jgi:deoxyribose-phosphate aldolase
VFEDICRVVKAAAPAQVKVILETSALDTEQKIIGCTLSKLAGAHFVKTSTAYADGGATLDDVRLMYQVVKGRCQVKAAGGIRDIHEVLSYLQAGARRFGSTRTDHFVRAFQDLPAKTRTTFAEYLPGPSGASMIVRS